MIQNIVRATLFCAPGLATDEQDSPRSNDVLLPDRMWGNPPACALERRSHKFAAGVCFGKKGPASFIHAGVRTMSLMCPMNSDTGLYGSQAMKGTPGTSDRMQASRRR